MLANAVVTVPGDARGREALPIGPIRRVVVLGVQPPGGPLGIADPQIAHPTRAGVDVAIPRARSGLAGFDIPLVLEYPPIVYTDVNGLFCKAIRRGSHAAHTIFLEDAFIAEQFVNMNGFRVWAKTLKHSRGEIRRGHGFSFSILPRNIHQTGDDSSTLTDADAGIADRHRDLLKALEDGYIALPDYLVASDHRSTSGMDGGHVGLICPYLRVT